MVEIKYCKNCKKEIPANSKQVTHCSPKCCYEFHHLKWKRNKRKTELITERCSKCSSVASTYYKTKPLCKPHYDIVYKKDRSIRYAELKARREQ